MRIVFYNPHTNIWFKKPLYFYLTKRKSVNKYEYFLDYLLKNNVEFSFLVDGRDFSFGRKYFNSVYLARVEIFLWSLFNNINPLRVKTLTKISNLNCDDVLFIFLYGSLLSINDTVDGKNKLNGLIRELKATKAKKVGHLTHYMYDAKLGGVNTRDSGIDYFVAENNLLKNSKFFNTYFDWYNSDFIVWPFVAQKRFINKVRFSERSNLVFATGTLPFPIKNQEFIDFFKISDIHPMRRQIYENRDNLKHIIKSFIYEMGEGKKAKEYNSRLYNKLNNFIFSHFKNKQTNYFSFDLVEMYNLHKMFIVPEEINGLPGIGFIEGLMCGCVLIGKEGEYYEDLGFVNGINFIAYDGTLEDLKSKIIFYQNNPNLLDSISNNSFEFVQNNFCQDYVSSIFLEKLQKLVV
jgi:glycosyltransferase involved in cell wall biosynthesis